MVRFSLTVLEMLRSSMGTMVPQHGDCAGMPMAQGKGGSSVLCGADPNMFLQHDTNRELTVILLEVLGGCNWACSGSTGNPSEPNGCGLSTTVVHIKHNVTCSKGIIWLSSMTLQWCQSGWMGCCCR